MVKVRCWPLGVKGARASTSISAPRSCKARRLREERGMAKGVGVKGMAGMEFEGVEEGDVARCFP